MLLWATLLDRLGLRPTVGQRGERAAAAHLRRHGYRILHRNLRNRYGEVDLLAEAPDRRTICVTEVKAREIIGNPAAAPRPEVHVNRHKQRKLVALAVQLVRAYRLADRPVRFDVVGVDLPRGAPPIVRHHPGAFESHI